MTGEKSVKGDGGTTLDILRSIDSSLKRNLKPNLPNLDTRTEAKP
jgi:hypothetical protein